MISFKATFGITFGNGSLFVFRTDREYVAGAMPTPPEGVLAYQGQPLPTINYYTEEEVDALAEASSHPSQ